MPSAAAWARAAMAARRRRPTPGRRTGAWRAPLGRWRCRPARAGGGRRSRRARARRRRRRQLVAARLRPSAVRQAPAVGQPGGAAPRWSAWLHRRRQRRRGRPARRRPARRPTDRWPPTVEHAPDGPGALSRAAERLGVVLARPSRACGGSRRGGRALGWRRRRAGAAAPGASIWSRRLAQLGEAGGAKPARP